MKTSLLDEEPEPKDDEELQMVRLTTKPKEEPVRKREIQKLRFRLQKDLEILEDLIDMELERKRVTDTFLKRA